MATEAPTMSDHTSAPRLDKGCEKMKKIVSKKKHSLRRLKLKHTADPPTIPDRTSAPRRHKGCEKMKNLVAKEKHILRRLKRKLKHIETEDRKWEPLEYCEYSRYGGKCYTPKKFFESAIPLSGFRLQDRHICWL